MASAPHQFILDCIIRKMRNLGFEPVGAEGRSTIISGLKMPKKIIRHRPDLVGVDISKNICIGEAKTFTDIFSRRSREQIIDFSKTGFLVILGYPNSVDKQIRNSLANLIEDNEKIILLKVPDELMPNEEI